MASRSIFDGFDDLISAALGLRPGQHLGQKSAYNTLDPTAFTTTALADLVTTLYGQMQTNWTGRIPSRENWRQQRQTTLDPANRSPEVLLERAVAGLSESGALGDWHNQVPVASGLVDGYGDKRAAIDLVKIEPGHATLVELKWQSDNPAFAVFEILLYGLAFIFSRSHSSDFDYRDKELLQVQQLTLQVLAPVEFYSGPNLHAVADGLLEGLRRVSNAEIAGTLDIGFGFRAFPDGFEPPFATGAEVLAQRQLPADAAPNRVIIDAMENLVPVWTNP